MPSPNFTFAFIVATLIGSLFHLIVGGGARRLTIFLLSAWIGFALGHVLTYNLPFDIARIGDINIVGAVIGASFALGLAYVFTSDRSKRRLSR